MNRIRSTAAALLVACSYAGGASAAGYALGGSAAPMAPDGVVRTPAAITANAISNGSFEVNGGAGTSLFTGWTVVDQANSSGSWFVQTGAVSPFPAHATPVNPPTNGSFAAMTDQTGAGSHVLYQNVTIPAEGAVLSFDLLLKNMAAYSSPASLDFTVTPNQQFRVDLMSTAATDFDVGSGVLTNLYQTTVASPASFGYARIVAPIAGTGAARTVRLRFAEVDNQNFFSVGIDNVALDVAASVPAASNRAWLLLAMASAILGLLALGRRLRASR